jgi:hypothetical protein
MNRPDRPFPIPSDLAVDKPRPADHIVRAAVAQLRAYIGGGTPANIARTLWGDDRVTPIILRAATGPAMTTTVGWAKEIATVAIFDLLQSITSISAAAELIGRGLQIDMTGVAQFFVPGRVLNANAAGQWIVEAGPAPARQLSFSNAAVLQPRKLSVLTAFSREQIESSNIENIVRQTLGEAAGLALDQRMFSANAASASAPAGLFAGVTPQTPTAGGGINAMEGDLKNLFTALAAQGGGKTAVIVAAVPQAVTLKMTVGPKFDYDIIESTGLAAGTVAAVEVASFVSGFSSVPEFETGRDAAIHFEDTAPADPIMGGVPVKSMFQIDSTALRMRLWASFGMRAAGHAQFVTGATW